MSPGRKCCVTKCKNYVGDTDIIFYSFPGKILKKELRQKWVEWVRNINK